MAHFAVLVPHLVDDALPGTVESVAVAVESALAWLKLLVEQSLVFKLAALMGQSNDTVVLHEVLRVRDVHVGTKHLLDMVPQLKISLLRCLKRVLGVWVGD